MNILYIKISSNSQLQNRVIEVYEHDNRGRADILPTLTLLVILENYGKFIRADISKTE